MDEKISLVISIARDEIGYLEKKSAAQLDDKTANAGSGNYTKYARDLDSVSWFNGHKQGSSWCSVFVSWCFWQAFGMRGRNMLFHDLKDNCAAGCGYARKYFNKRGFLSDNPEPGDQIFFWSSDKSTVSHTGLVASVDGGRVYTIEGNTSDGTSVVANGGAVCAKSYPLNYARIAGYGHPDWYAADVAAPTDPIQEHVEEPAKEPEPAPAPSVSYTAQVYADKGKTVNLRSSTSKLSSLLCTVPVGTVVTVTEERDGWAKFTYNKQTGWMMREYLRDPDTAPSNTVTMDRTKLLEIRACLADALSVINKALRME